MRRRWASWRRPRNGAWSSRRCGKPDRTRLTDPWLWWGASTPNGSRARHKRRFRGDDELQAGLAIELGAATALAAVVERGFAFGDDEKIAVVLCGSGTDGLVPAPGAA